MRLLAAESRLLYTLLIAGVAVQRLAELRLSRRHLRRLLARGGVEAAPRHYRAMVLLHGAFLAACPLEVWLLRRPFRPLLAAAMVIVLAAAAALRLWAIATLGERWTTRIVYLPGAAPVESGPYRYLRHPNYLAVVAEMAALPLLHGAWLSALVFSAANAVVLAVRIRAEEAALAAGTAYRQAFAGRGRLLPWRLWPRRGGVAAARDGGAAAAAAWPAEAASVPGTGLAGDAAAAGAGVAEGSRESASEPRP
jgi:methyltransferase